MGTSAYGTLLLTGLMAPEQAIPGDFRKGLIAAAAWTMIDLTLAVALSQATVATFDRCLERISKRLMAMNAGSRKPDLLQ